jgi:flagellar biosynthesis GTPase FlhF
MRLLDEKLADMDELMVMVNRRLETVDAPPLLENVHRSWQDSVLSRARELCGSDGVPDAAQLFTALVEQIPVQAGLEFSAADGRRGPSAFALIGPTGVGKTTTLAKLAAKCVLGENLKVGLVTLDTFRLAGVDQLREYAGLLGVELRVAFSATELTRHMEHFRDRDVILIDTPGRSQFDEEGIQAVRDGIGPVPGVCTLLTVPAGLRREDATSIVESYSALSPRGLVLTKSDEATRCDGLSTLFEKAGVPVVYLTDGQRVPEDIHEASAEAVASMIVANDAISVGAGTGDCGHAVDE